MATVIKSGASGECARPITGGLEGVVRGYAWCEFQWPNLTEMRLGQAFGFCAGRMSERSNRVPWPPAWMGTRPQQWQCLVAWHDLKVTL